MKKMSGMLLLGGLMLAGGCGLEPRGVQDNTASLQKHGNGKGNDDDCKDDDHDRKKKDRVREKKSRSHDDDCPQNPPGDGGGSPGSGGNGGGGNGGGGNGGGGDNSGPPLQYSDVAPIIQSACVKCHNPAGAADFLPLTTLAEVQGARQAMIDAISSGFMPMGNAAFQNSPEAAKLLKWLRSGQS